MVTTSSSLRRALLGLAAAAIVACAAPARAETAPVAEPRAHHAAVASARAHEDLRLTATFDHPEQIRGAAVVYEAHGALKMVPFLRAPQGDAYLAVIPASDVTAPGLAYAIEIERTDGKRVAAFASRAALSPVLVMEDHTDVRERAALERLGGRRSVITASADYVRFGTTRGTSALPCAGTQPDCPAGQSKVPSVNDQFWRVEVGYTYRMLRAVAELGIKLGVVRGSSLVPLDTLDTSKYDVGLNYAEPWVRFRMADAWHLEVAALASITEVGFSIGGSTALIIGDPYGTRLTLGAEDIGFGSTYFGSRFYSRVDFLIREGMTIAPVVEVTNMPHADAYGVRLYGDTSFALPKGFGFGVRGGYQARRSTSGGVGIGTTVWYSF